jgi:hypothetical protein
MTTTADGGLPMAEIFSGATLSFYSGEQPDDPDDAMVGELLLEITGVSFGTASGGAIAIPTSPTLSGFVQESYTVQSFRLEGTGGESLDGSVGADGDIRFLSHQWEESETLEVTSLTLTMPME